MQPKVCIHWNLYIIEVSQLIYLEYCLFQLFRMAHAHLCLTWLQPLVWRAFLSAAPLGSWLSELGQYRPIKTLLWSHDRCHQLRSTNWSMSCETVLNLRSVLLNEMRWYNGSWPSEGIAPRRRPSPSTPRSGRMRRARRRLRGTSLRWRSTAKSSVS